MNGGVTRAGRLDGRSLPRTQLAQLVAQLGYDPELATAVLITHDAVRVAVFEPGATRAVTYVHPVVDDEAAS